MLRFVLVMLLASISGVQAASAATPAVSTSNVNLRAGPSTEYPVVTVVPAGSGVVTHGCVSEYTWCDIAFGTYRGWVSAQHIQIMHDGKSTIVGPAVAVAAGIAVVAYSQSYWDTHYVSYPWYGSWANYPAYRAPIGSSTTIVGTNGGTASRTIGCAGGRCGATGTATGAQGGTAAGARGCGPHGCGAAGAVTGPGGNSAAGARGCGPKGCGAVVVGPQGNTAHRRIPR